MRHAWPAGFALVPLVGMVFALCGCQPALNWRVLTSPQARLTLSFPCKPDLELRAATSMGLLQCEVGDARFSVSWADVADPAGVGAALVEMPRRLADKLGIPVPAGLPLSVPGMTPHAEAASYRLEAPGRVVRLAVFAYGRRAYQVMRTGPTDDLVAWDAFVHGLRVGGASEVPVPAANM